MKLRITVEGKTYEVEVEVLDETRAGPTAYSAAAQSTSATPPMAAPTTNPPPAAEPAPPSSAAPTGYVVEAPIVGTILQLKVATGDAVAINQVLLVMESMKMETNIASPIAGKIKTIHVSQGQAVKAGQVLVEFE